MGRRDYYLNRPNKIATITTITTKITSLFKDSFYTLFLNLRKFKKKVRQKISFDKKKKQEVVDLNLKVGKTDNSFIERYLILI